MNKHIYIVRGNNQEDYKSFKNRILEDLKTISKNENIIDLKCTITDLKPPTFSIIPFRKDKITIISAKSNSEIPLNEIEEMDGFQAGYSVEEALPVAYHKNLNMKISLIDGTMDTRLFPWKSILYGTTIET